MKAQAITIFRHQTIQRSMMNYLSVLTASLPTWPFPSIEGRLGQRTRPFVKRLSPSNKPAWRAFLPLRWKPQPFLYAFAQTRSKAVICFAHVTNQMGEGDFEKGVADGSHDALQIIAQTAKAWASKSPHAGS